MVKALELQLHSPAGTDPDVYSWPLIWGRGSGKTDGAIELVETIRWVCQEFPEVVMDNNILSNYDTKSYESMKSLVGQFNNAVDASLQRSKSKTCPGESFMATQRRSSRNLLRHILQQVYNKAVTNPEKLNQYEPFSPEVYGETSFELVCQIIDRLNASEEDTFLDLGSGIGQIVLQVAASTPCKMVWGIERSEWPNFYADKMDFHFKRLMRWWGKPYGKYQLIKGDFLDQRHSEKISSARIIFVNNFAFGPKLDHQLKERFSDLRDGTRIVSSKEFCPLNFRISDRNLSDIGTIMQVSKLSPLEGSVSWTGKSILYYVHTIDRTKLMLYFNQLKEIGTSRNQKDVNRPFQIDSSSNVLVPQPSDLVGARLPIMENGVQSGVATRTRRTCRREEVGVNQTNRKKRVKIDVVANLNSAGKPIGRVGKQVRCQGIKKKNSTLDLDLLKLSTTSSKNPSPVSQQHSCDISTIADSVHNRNSSTETIGADYTANIISPIEMYLDTIRNEMTAAISMLKDGEYRRHLINEIEFQRKLKIKMSLQAVELDKEIIGLMQIENKLRQQQEVIYRSKKFNQVNANIAEISIVNQESVLKEISLAMPLRKRLSCKIVVLSPEKIYRGSPGQRQNDSTRCVKTQSQTPKSTSLHHPIAWETLPVPQVLLGYDLEDKLKNLIISALNDNANLSAKAGLRQISIARQIQNDPSRTSVL